MTLPCLWKRTPLHSPSPSSHGQGQPSPAHKFAGWSVLAHQPFAHSQPLIRAPPFHHSSQLDNCSVVAAVSAVLVALVVECNRQNPESSIAIEPLGFDSVHLSANFLLAYRLLP